MSNPIYALVLSLPEQRAVIEKHCLGDCGNLIIGGITDPDFGAFLDGALSQN